MTSLLPGPIADARFKAIEQIVTARLAALPIDAVLVYALDNVAASALPSLAWQFGALGPTWQATAGDDAAQRVLIRKVLARRRIRGVHAAVQDALESAGFEAYVRSAIDVPFKYDGSFKYNGLMTYSYLENWRFWVVVVGEPDAATLTSIQNIVKEWQRKSLRFDVFWVETAEQLTETEAYHGTD